MERELRLRIILEKPPADVDFGLQKGRGSAYETVQTQRSKSSDLHFEFNVGIKPGLRESCLRTACPLTAYAPRS